MDKKYIIKNEAIGTIEGTKAQIDFIMSAINSKGCYYWDLANLDSDNKELWEEEALKCTRIYCDMFDQREAQNK